MFFRTITIFSAFLATSLFFTAPINAATLISFEQGYSDDQVLQDGSALLDEHGNATNVIISTVHDNTMSVEASGQQDGGPDAFVNDPMGKNDTISPGATGSLGNFFLRATEALDGNYLNYKPVFTLTFKGGVSKVAAEIWDIDGNPYQGSEGWRVVATFSDQRTSHIDSPQFMTTSNTGSLNGQAWNFNFQTAGNDILSLDFIFTGTKQHGIGVAFDNLTVSAVPLPSAGFALIAGIGALGALRRRKAPQN